MQYEQNGVSAEGSWSVVPRHAEHIAALEAMESNPPGGEPVLEAYSRAALRALSDGPSGLGSYKDQIADFLARRTDMTAESAQQLEWRIRQHYIGGHDDYPTAFTDESKWYDVLSDTSQPFTKATNSVDYMLHTYTVQTNEPRRAAGVLLAASLFTDRYPSDGARIVDLGSSVDLILGQLKFNTLPPHIPRIYNQTIEGRPLDRYVKDYIQAIFAGRLALGESWGIDIKTDSDYRTSGWVTPGCLYPSEYGAFKTEGKLQGLKKLLAMPNHEFRRNGLHHEQADFTNPEHMADFISTIGAGQVDIVTSQTTWYQHSATKEQRMHLWESLQLHRKLLVPGQGIEIRMEHAVPLKEDPNQFDWTTVYGDDAHYNLLVRDEANPKAGYELYATFSNGRLRACHIGQPLIDRMFKIGLL